MKVRYETIIDFHPLGSGSREATGEMEIDPATISPEFNGDATRECVYRLMQQFAGEGQLDLQETKVWIDSK